MAIKRGFEDFVEHDTHIIQQWNSVVGKRDTVWVLGDITMEKSFTYPLLDQLKGFKKIVLGNHDRPQDVPKLLEYVNGVCGLKKFKKGIILSHAPIHPCEMGRYKLNIHGHVHENTLPDRRYANVSAEVINYIPVDIKQLIEERVVP